MLRRAARLTTAGFAELLLVGLILILLGGRTVGRLDEGGGDDGATASDLTLRLDLNRASWHELVCLPGIGEVRAREIVRDRRERGPFSGPDELDRVKGIGPVTIRRVREFIRE
jgi:competence ComEA-like helix-hairpin-helix protein